MEAVLVAAAVAARVADSAPGHGGDATSSFFVPYVDPPLQKVLVERNLGRRPLITPSRQTFLVHEEVGRWGFLCPRQHPSERCRRGGDPVDEQRRLRLNTSGNLKGILAEQCQSPTLVLPQGSEVKLSRAEKVPTEPQLREPPAPGVGAWGPITRAFTKQLSV